MSRTLRVGAVQMDSKAGQVGENLERAEAWIAQAAGLGVQIIVLPELSEDVGLHGALVCRYVAGDPGDGRESVRGAPHPQAARAGGVPEGELRRQREDRGQ